LRAIDALYQNIGTSITTSEVLNETDVVSYEDAGVELRLVMPTTVKAKVVAHKKSRRVRRDNFLPRQFLFLQYFSWGINQDSLQQTHLVASSKKCLLKLWIMLLRFQIL
jgi:hypothetical protein